MAAPIELLEREAELEEIRAAASAATSREGRVLTIEGEAGIGKTSLLDAVAKVAAERGMTVLRARGGVHERDFPYGVVRQLLEPAVAALGGAESLAGAAALAAPAFGAREEAEPGDPFAVQHGLYWLAADLADREPLALLVDDAQWADGVSLRALAYVANRVAGLPLLLAIGIRVGEPEVDEDLVDELRRAAQGGWLRPRPLGAAAVAAVVARELGDGAAAELAAACQHASAGNPFLLGETLRALAGTDLDVATGDGLVEELAAAGAARSILLRLGALGDDALAVARAVAVLEPNAGARPVAALAKLDAVAVAAATEQLVAARLLADATPLAFAHPLVRAAVYEDMSQPRRATLHARAARLLSEHGGSRDAVAGHLLRAEPAGDAWAATELRAAAAGALGRGAPESAVSYLRRALAEPPPQAERDAFELDLGRAQLRADDWGGIATLVDLRSRSSHHAADVQLTVDLAVSLAVRGRTSEAVPILERALAGADPHSADGWFLRATLLVMPVYGFEGIPPAASLELGETIDPETLPGRMLLEFQAFLRTCGAGRLGDAAGVARDLAADRDAGLANAEAGYPPLLMCIVLALTGAVAETIFEELIETTRRRGALSGVAAGLGGRSLSRAANGDLRAAEVDAGTALAIVAGNDHVLEAYWLATLVRVLTARGELADADAALAGSAFAARPPSGMPGAMLLCARGELHLAAGRAADARGDFRAAAARLEWLPHASEELLGWRVGLARAEAALGERDEAAALVDDAVAAARAIADPRSLGVALRARGQLATSDGVEALREAVDVLAGTDARLHHAHALVDLGAALRRRNSRRDAREPLRAGLDLAHRCGAAALEQRARTELAATGARPRTPLLSGVEALTPSELRIARMAADGMTNREIAQQLFVTAKTVETHLRHAYRKLDVTKRTELAAKL